MSDERLRDLERRWRETGEGVDRDAYELEASRAGYVLTGFLRGESGIFDRVYVGGVKRSVNLRPLRSIRDDDGLVSVGRLFDVEFAEGRLHLLIGTHSSEMLHSIDTDGRLETRRIDVPLPNHARVHKLVSVDGELGFVASGIDGLRTVILGGNRRLRMQGIIHGYVPSKGYLAVTAENYPYISRLVLYGWDKGRVLSDRDIEGVYVQDKIICCFNGEDGFVGKVKQVMQEKYGLILPQYSRLVTGMRLARPDGFGRCYDAHSKTLLEVPERNIEGLLIALDRAENGREVNHDD